MNSKEIARKRSASMGRKRLSFPVVALIDEAVKRTYWIKRRIHKLHPFVLNRLPDKVTELANLINASVKEMHMIIGEYEDNRETRLKRAETTHNTVREARDDKRNKTKRVINRRKKTVKDYINEQLLIDEEE
jgi:hypothetical protein